MTHPPVPAPPADLGQALDDAEQLLPALFTFALLPLLGVVGTGALGLLYVPPLDFLLSLLDWIW